MSATYDLATNIGKIRRLVGDTSTAAAHFTDEELQFFLDEGGSIYMASALALESWAAELSRQGKSVKLGQFSEDKGDPVPDMMALATKLRRKHNAGGGLFRTVPIDWIPQSQAEREATEAEL